MAYNEYITVTLKKVKPMKNIIDNIVVLFVLIVLYLHEKLTGKKIL